MSALIEAQKAAVEHWRSWSIGYRSSQRGKVDPCLLRDVGPGYPFCVRVPLPKRGIHASDWFRRIFVILQEQYGPEGLDRISSDTITAAPEPGRWIATVVDFTSEEIEELQYTYDIWFVNPHDAFDFKLRHG